MTSSGFEFEEPIFRRVRHVSNYAHNTINSADVSVPEMPIPEFRGNDGFWNTSGSNGDYGNGFIDFSQSDCTDGKSSWYIEYLLGESELNANNVGGDYGKPHPFGKSNWDMDNVHKNTPNEGGTGKNFEHIWTTRGGGNPGPVVCIDRNAENRDHRFSWGYLDNQRNFGSPTTVSPGSGNKAHYIRAKGITFRYETGFYENTQVGDEDKHGITPIRSMGLIFMKSTNGNGRDYTAYYAELLMEVNGYTSNNASGRNGVNGILDISRQNNKRQYHNVDWKTTYEIMYNEPVTDPETGEESTRLKKIMGGGPWDEFGAYSHYHYYVSSKFDRANKPPTKQTGYATLMLSARAVKKIWDDDMVCVGMAVTSSHSSRGYTMVGSTSHFKMWDVKLLEMEHSTDNELVHPPEDSLDTQYMSTVMRAAGTVGDKINEFCRISRAEGRYPNYEFELDTN